MKKFLGATRRRRKKDNSRLWKAYYYVFINHRDAPMDSKGPHTHTHSVYGKCVWRGRGDGKCYWLRASKMAAPGWKVGRVEGESA